MSQITSTRIHETSTAVRPVRRMRPPMPVACSRYGRMPEAAFYLLAFVSPARDLTFLCCHNQCPRGRCPLLTVLTSLTRRKQHCEVHFEARHERLFLNVGKISERLDAEFSVFIFNLCVERERQFGPLMHFNYY